MFRTRFDEEKRQWNGVETKPHSWPRTSLGSEILQSLQLYGSSVAQICADTGNTKTFAEIRVLTINTAKSLRYFGCEKGDLIYFMTRNTVDVAPIIFAALYLGVQVTALPAFFTRVEYESFLQLLKPKLLFCDLDIYHQLKQCLAYLDIDAETFTFDGSTDRSIPVNILFEERDADTYIEPAEINAFTHTAYILETSGTTGRRKCVRISHAAILDKMRRLKCIFGPSDIVLGFTILDGVSGIRSLIGPTLNGSTRIVNHDPFTPKRYFDIVEKFKVTVSICSAQKAFQLQNHPEIEFTDLSSLKFFCSGGTKSSYQVIRNMNKYLPRGKFCQTFGMTETAGTVATNLKHTKNDCVGQLIGGCKAMIVNEAGERLGIGEIGELCLKFPCPILGYLGGDQNPDNYLDSEGFFLTGDLARFDENNDLFIVARKKEVFKCFGYPVTPTQIEEYLNKIDGVKQSCVVPISVQNFNFLPASVIVKTTHSKCTEQSIYNLVSNNLSYYKHLRGGVYFVDELPVTARGKVDRILVKKMANEFFKKSKLAFVID